MKLSVLIVNYNVCYFTEHCVWSVLKAAEVMQHHKPAWQTEILVFDNASADNSAVYLPKLFGDKISFFSSGTNLGFGKANNQLLEKATGEYILYLNPDTMIPEDCLLNHVRFAESADNFGASGIRMIDGRGKFLPESKRGFPGTWVSFTKMAGLAKAFPESKLFAQYYVGHLDENTTAEVPVLSGAYLLAKRSLLAELGGFDEQFFMYAEDIDLSYRITKAGFKNYYFAEDTIVHFKGESTRKDRKYIKQFYYAMLQFVRKHFKSTAGKIYSGMMEAAISLRAGISMVGKSSPKERETITTSFKTYLLGDKEAIDIVLENLVRGTGPVMHQVTKSSSEATEVIYCIGRTYTLTDAIAAMQRSEVPAKKFFRAEAASLVGSDSSNEQGTSEHFDDRKV